MPTKKYKIKSTVLLHRFSLLVFIVLLGFQSSADHVLQVVEQSTQLPVSGVTITETWTDPSSTKPNQFLGQTNSDGTYILHEDVIKYQGSVLITHPNYQTINVSSFYLLDKGFRISISPTKTMLDEVVISANKFEESKKDIPRQIESIQRKEIRFANQPTTAELLQNTGQIFVQKSQMGGGSPVLRGFEANKILLVVDGIRMNNAIYRGGHLQNILRMDQNMLERTEVLFGPGSVMYGSDAMGGVIHLTTLQPKLSTTTKPLLTGHSFMRYGSVNNELTAHADVNTGFQKWAFLSSVTYSQWGNLKQGEQRNSDMGQLGLRDSVQQRINGVDVATANQDASMQTPSAYHQLDAMQKIVFAPNKHISHQLNLQFSVTGDVPRYDRLTEKPKGTFSSAEWYYGPELRTLAAYNLTLTNKNRWYDELRILPSYQYIEESRHNRNFGSNSKNHRNEYVHVVSTNIEADKKIRNNEFRYGFEFTYNNVVSNANTENIATGKVRSQSTRYPDGGSNMTTAAAYLSHAIEFSPKLILSEAIRFNYVELNARFVDKTFYSFLPNSMKQQNTAVNGQLGLVYLPGNDWKLSTSLSNSFRAPNVDDVGKLFDSKSGEQAIIPNPELKPEYSYNAEFGISKIWAKKVKTEVTGYYTWVKDLIGLQHVQVNGADSIPFNGAATYVVQNRNNTNAYIYGTSLTVNVDVSKHITLVNTFNFTYGRIKTDSTDYPLDHIPPMFGRSAINVYAKGIQGEFFVLYNGWKRIADYNLNGEDNEQYATAKGMPAWYTLNLRLSYTYPFTSRYVSQLQAGCENILDRNYRTFASGISAPGRNLFVAVRFSF
jgi:hemoglobin/transferrin/lactoferrin receptor protein